MLQVNHERVAKLLQGLAAFTDSEEGVTRLAYSPLDKKAQSWLLEQVQDLHLQIRTDAVGNVFLRRDGKQPQLPPVASGSHLDTVMPMTACAVWLVPWRRCTCCRTRSLSAVLR